MASSSNSIAALYADERSRLNNMLRRKGVSAQGAADAVQEAFVRVLSAPREDVRDFKSYLRRTAVTVAIDNYRRELREPSLGKDIVEVDDTLIDPAPLAEATLISQEEVRALDAALRELPPRCREVLILHKFEGLSYAEISDRLGIAKNTVMVHMVKALGCLKSSLRDNNLHRD